MLRTSLNPRGSHTEGRCRVTGSSTRTTQSRRRSARASTATFTKQKRKITLRPLARRAGAEIALLRRPSRAKEARVLLRVTPSPTRPTSAFSLLKFFGKIQRAKGTRNWRCRRRLGSFETSAAKSSCRGLPLLLSAPICSFSLFIFIFIFRFRFSLLSVCLANWIIRRL